jgi:hypothetical protein
MIRKKVVRKQQETSAMDGIVEMLIQDQQQLLKAMIQKEASRVKTEVVMGTAV